MKEFDITKGILVIKGLYEEVEKKKLEWKTPKVTKEDNYLISIFDDNVIVKTRLPTVTAKKKKAITRINGRRYSLNVFFSVYEKSL